jgi:hypothetical protein
MIGEKSIAQIASPIKVKTAEALPPNRYHVVLKDIEYREAKVDESGNEWKERLHFIFLTADGKETSKFTATLMSEKSGLNEFVRMLTLPGEMTEEALKDPNSLWQLLRSLIGREYWADVEFNKTRTWTYVSRVIPLNGPANRN